MREQFPNHAHKVFFVFVCDVGDDAPAKPTVIDLDAEEAEWVDLARLDGVNLLPAVVKDNLTRILAADEVLYLGGALVP